MTVYMNDKLRERLEALAAQKAAEELGLRAVDVAGVSKKEVVGRLIQEHCEPIVDEEKWYEDELNLEVENEVTICGYRYLAGSALRKIDPIAFREGLLEALGDNERFVNVAEQYYFVEDVETMLARLA